MENKNIIIKNVVGAVERKNGIFYVNTAKGEIPLPEFLGILEQSRSGYKYIGPVTKEVGGINTLVVLMEVSVPSDSPAAELFVSEGSQEQAQAEIQANAGEARKMSIEAANAAIKRADKLPSPSELYGQETEE